MNLNLKAPVLALALFSIAGTAFSQVKKRAVPSTRNKPAAASAQFKAGLLPVDANVIIGKLPNGLTYYIRKNSEPRNRAELYLVNKVGSVLENDNQQGLAHFTEHMAFNGTRDFPKNELVNYLQKSGIKFGADLNAYTSFDETVYQLPLPTDTLSVFTKGFNILANWAAYQTFDPKEIDAERGVVLSEKRDGGKNARERLTNQTLPVILNNSRYALRMPIGKDDILNTFTPATIQDFYHTWYRPDLQAVIAVGDFDPKFVQQQIIEDFSSLKNPPSEKTRTVYQATPTPGTAVKIATDKEFPYTLAEIIVKHPETTVKNANDLLQSIRIQLFNQMLNDRLAELLQKPNPPFIFGQASYGAFIGRQDAFTSVMVAKPGELETAVKAVVAETDRVRQFGFTLTELERAKQNALVQIDNAYREKDKTPSASFVSEYQQNFLTGEAIPGIGYEHDFYVNNISRIGLADLNALALKFVSSENRVVLVEAPDKDKDKLPDEKTLLAWISSAGKDLKPYVDYVVNKPLLDKEPVAGRITDIKTDSTIDVTTVTLSNGVHVILKPTTFKNDQVLINGYSFGGTSVASDADYTSADLAGNVIGSSGIAGFNQIQLNKQLSGKNANVSPYISDVSAGITASTTPKDFQTAMQLIYLYFTQPRKDPEVWDATINQTKALLVNRSLEPRNVFQDTVSAVMSNYNFRGSATTTALLNGASLDKAFNFYKEQFANAGSFTFTIVGNFTIDVIKPYLEVYLASLPAAGKTETYKNLEIHPPAGQITKTVYRGEGEKASVELIFDGPYTYNDAGNLQMDALEEILQIKMDQRLREQESGAYSPGVRASYKKIPAGRYTFTISFGCDPGNVEKLTNAAMDEINKIKQSGALPLDIQKFVAQEARSTQVQMKENIFWAGYLGSASQNQQNPDDILSHVSRLGDITPQSTKEAANKYLAGNNLIKFILLPAKK